MCGKPGAFFVLVMGLHDSSGPVKQPELKICNKKQEGLDESNGNVGCQTFSRAAILSELKYLS